MKAKIQVQQPLIFADAVTGEILLDIEQYRKALKEDNIQFAIKL